MYRLKTILIVLVLCAGCGLGVAAGAASADPVSVLLDLMEERLRLMPAVAQHKWTLGQAIDDPAREAAILEAMAEAGPRYGLTPEMAKAFFRGQIEAAKLVQRGLFDRWKAEGQGGFPDAPDLKTLVRPALDSLTPRLLAALAEALPLMRQTGSAERIRTVPDAWKEFPEAWAAAVSPLLNAVATPAD